MDSDRGSIKLKPDPKGYDEKNFVARSGEAQDRIKYQVEFAQSALKSLVLVNGGGILSLLTALGNSSMHHDNQGMFWSFVWFGCGLGSGLTAYFGAFFSQLYFYNAAQQEAWDAQARAHSLATETETTGDFERGNRSMRFGLIAATASLSSFVIGAFVALNALI